MDATKLNLLISQILNGDISEGQCLEIKAHYNPLFDTVHHILTAFSNQDSGGTIIFGIGVSQEQGPCITGIQNPQAVRTSILEQCREIEPMLQVSFSECCIDGKTVLAAEVPGLDSAVRPAFNKLQGFAKGAFIRIENRVIPMSERELYTYEIYRKRLPQDGRTVEDAILDESSVSAMLAQARNAYTKLGIEQDNHELAARFGITTKDGIPTLAGTLLFSHHPQLYFPNLCISAVSYPGTIRTDDAVGKRIPGSVADMTNAALSFIKENCTSVPYPEEAIREAILNAIMHRDYSEYVEKQPILLELFCDRLEITNPGGLIGSATTNDLGNEFLEIRNRRLTALLEMTGIARCNNSGIRVMRRECQKAGLSAPVFTSQGGSFKVTFYSASAPGTDAVVSEEPAAIRTPLTEIFSTSKTVRLAEQVLAVCATPHTRREIADILGKSQNYIVSQIVTPLYEQGWLQTNGLSFGSRNLTFETI